LPNYGLILPNYADKSDKMMNEYWFNYVDRGSMRWEGV
jgi:hypothetical protein